MSEPKVQTSKPSVSTTSVVRNTFPALTHKQLVALICEYLAQMGVMHTESDAGVTFDRSGNYSRRRVSTRGWPDITLTVPMLGAADTTGKRRVFGIFGAIEVKVGPDKLSDDQHAVLSHIERHGGLVCVARSLDDVIDAFGGYFRNYQVYLKQHGGPVPAVPLNSLTNEVARHGKKEISLTHSQRRKSGNGNSGSPGCAGTNGRHSGGNGSARTDTGSGNGGGIASPGATKTGNGKRKRRASTAKGRPA